MSNQVLDSDWSSPVRVSPRHLHVLYIRGGGIFLGSAEFALGSNGVCKLLSAPVLTNGSLVLSAAKFIT